VSKRSESMGKLRCIDRDGPSWRLFTMEREGRPVYGEN
jgi:hypothetical protein